MADGLGFSSEQWQQGDFFWQEHAFDQVGSYLETGLYNYLSGERLTFETETGAGTLVRLPSRNSSAEWYTAASAISGGNHALPGFNNYNVTRCPVKAIP